MLDKAKYIIFGRNRFIMFDPQFKHNEIANLLNLEKIVSAGFVGDCGNGIQCFGESLSLGLKSRPEDTNVIKRYLED